MLIVIFGYNKKQKQMTIQELNKLRIPYLEQKIEEERDSIKNCINQNFFEVARRKIDRIEKLRQEINQLKSI